MTTENRQALMDGLRDGTPIGLGYFVVGFSLGIVAKYVGLSPLQGFVISLLNNASAGEYAAFVVMKSDAPYFEIALMTLVANARYLLMSAVLSQKFSSDAPFYPRILIGFAVTDELFGITVARGSRWLNPFYNYGAMLTALPGWSLGTACGIVAWNFFSPAAVSALSVALYGMFLAVIIPPARKDKIIGGAVGMSFLLSFLAEKFFPEISAGNRTIALTILIAGAAAILFPVKEDDNDT